MAPSLRLRLLAPLPLITLVACSFSLDWNSIEGPAIDGPFAGSGGSGGAPGGASGEAGRPVAGSGSGAGSGSAGVGGNGMPMAGQAGSPAGSGGAGAGSGGESGAGAGGEGGGGAGGALGAYAKLILEAAPVAYYRFDDDFSSNLIRSLAVGGPTGGVSGGALQAVAGAIAGDDSKAAKFDGATVSLNNVFPFAPGSDFSFEFWFKPADPNAVVGVFSKHGAEPPLNVSVAGYYFTATKTQTTFTYDPPGGGLPPPIFKVNGPPPSTDAFTHVVITSDGDSDLSIYVNGEGPTTTLVNPEATSVGLFLLGTSPDGAFRGALDEFAVYDKVLPTQLVKDHYAIGRGPPARPARLAAPE